MNRVKSKRLQSGTSWPACFQPSFAASQTDGFDRLSRLGDSIQAHNPTPLTESHVLVPLGCQQAGVSVNQTYQLSETRHSGRLETDAWGSLIEEHPFHLRSRQSPSILRSGKRRTASKSILTHANVAALDSTGVQLNQSVRI